MMTKREENKHCLVCLEDLKCSDNMISCTECKQTLGHQSCLNIWINKHDTCPYCRVQSQFKITNNDESYLKYEQTLSDLQYRQILYRIRNEQMNKKYEQLVKKERQVNFCLTVGYVTVVSYISMKFLNN